MIRPEDLHPGIDCVQTLVAELSDRIRKGWFAQANLEGTAQIKLLLTVPGKLTEDQTRLLTNHLGDNGWQAELSYAYSQLFVPGADTFDRQYNPIEERVCYLSVILTTKELIIGING